MFYEWHTLLNLGAYSRMLLWKWEKAGGDSKAAALVFPLERRIALRNQSETLVKSCDRQRC